MLCKISQQVLSLEEKVSLQKFLAEHQAYCTRIQIDCAYSIRFTNTDTSGLGVGVAVVCKSCNKVHDITDYGSW